MKYHTLILFALGLGILTVLVLFIGPENILNAFKIANPFYILLAFSIQLLLFALWTERWAINIRAVGIAIKKLLLIPMLLVGMAVNNITPSARGGGEPVRAYILGNYTKCPLENSFATVVADRGLDTFPLFVLAIITILYAVLYLKLSLLLIFSLTSSLILLLLLFLFGLYISVNQQMGQKVTLWILNVLKWFTKKEHSKIQRNSLKALNGFQGSIRILMKNRGVLFYGLPLSFLIWFIEIIRLYIIFLAFNYPVSLELIAAVFVIAALIGMVPLIPGGLGAVDGMMILLFSVAGIPPSISAAATIIERLISFWLPSFLGISILPYYGSDVIHQISSKLSD